MLRKAGLAAKRRNENLGRRIETLLIKAHEYGISLALMWL
jgi:hypothetical protein